MCVESKYQFENNGEFHRQLIVFSYLIQRTLEDPHYQQLNHEAKSSDSSFTTLVTGNGRGG